MATTQTKTKKTVKKTVKKAVVSSVVKTTKKVTVSPKSSTKTQGTSLSCMNIDGKEVTSIVGSPSVFGVTVNTQLLAQAIRVYRANQREGSASTKTRGEVEGSTRKLYKQKGTGKARHGSIRAPLYVGGGIVFGPRPHAFTLQFPQAMRLKALFSAFTQKREENAILVVTGTKNMEPKTKVIAAFLKTAAIHKSTLCIVEDMGTPFVRATNNLKKVDVLPAISVSTYDVLMHQHILITKEALAVLDSRAKESN